MLARLISWSLAHRLVVVLVWLGVALVGLAAFRDLPIDAFPDTTPVQVQVHAVAPALGPLEIERQVTAPIERALAGLPDLLEVRSVSRAGFVLVTATFADGTDVWRARQVVSERLQVVALPDGIARPALGPVATGLGEVFHYLVRGDGHSLAELRTAQDWIIRPQLAELPGVAEVNSWGGDERRIEVVVDPLALEQHSLSLTQLVTALERNNANAGGGALERAGEATLVQGEALVRSPAELAEVVIDALDGVPVRVGDVAEVVEGREPRRGAVTAHGTGEVVLGLGFLLTGENSHTVTRRLALRLEEIQKSLPPGIEATPVYERTTIVDQVLATVRTNLLEGALLVVAVLFAFLGSLRAGLIVAAAIPFSMLFAFDWMLRAGITGTLMSLGAIDFGLIVDSSVILVENSMRRLASDDSTRSRAEIVREAALEVRRPTLFGELVLLVVYLPILTLEGIEGKLFRPMAWTVVFALAGSMLLSVTLMPVLASLALPRRPARAEGLVMRPLQALYRPLLAAALRRRTAVLAGALLLLAGGVALARTLGREFVPRLDEGALAINTVRLAGISVEESVRYGTRIEQALLEAFPDEIEDVWTRTGSAEIGTDPMGLEVSDVFVTLTPRARWTRAATQAELVQHMRALLADFPGMKAIFSQPIEMRVEEMTAGVRGDLGVKLFGDDLEVLAAKAAEVEALLEAIPGAAEVSTEQLSGQPTLSVAVDREALARNGIAAEEVLTLVSALGGIEVGELQEAERRFPIAVRLADAYRGDEEALGRVRVGAENGACIPLARLAHLTRAEGPAAIQREWGKRRILVQANVAGRDVGSFVAEARRVIDAQLALPPGYYLRYGGRFEHFERARNRLALVVPLALALVFALLYFTYGRLRDAARVFTGVPFAAVGGVAALALRGLPFSLSAGIGFVALSGVAVLGDMVLVSTIRQLEGEGLALGAAVRQAAERRLRPVLMTALVASLGFLPMALNTSVGSEVQRPLATVVIGGMLSSTLLTLVVLPVLYSLFRGREGAARS